MGGQAEAAEAHFFGLLDEVVVLGGGEALAAQGRVHAQALQPGDGLGKVVNVAESNDTAVKLADGGEASAIGNPPSPNLGNVVAIFPGVAANLKDGVAI
jgi:hypothetical protein